MKKKVIAMLLVLALSCTACANIDLTESEDKQGETETVTDEKKAVEEEKETVGEENNVAEKVEINVYYPDEMEEKLLIEVVECDELTEETVWNLLKEKNIISQECEINTFAKSDAGLELDVNEGFGMQLRSYGTTGERMMIACVVNTFLDAFQCELMTITENGQTLCSGHAEYEDSFTKFE